MNAEEARKKIEQLKESDKKAADKATRNLKAGDIKAAAEAKKDTQHHFTKIDTTIQEAIDRREHTAKYTARRNDEDHGLAYFSSLAEEIKKKYTADGFNISTLIRPSYGAVYEGYMNPEYVGSEYCAHTLSVDLDWKKTPKKGKQ